MSLKFQQPASSSSLTTRTHSKPCFLWSAIRRWVPLLFALPLLFLSHTLCLTVSHSFHSCPHILGSPVLRSRISLWNLMHLFPSLPGKRWRHEGKTQRKHRETERGIKRNLKRERDCEEDEEAEHQAARCLMRPHCGHVAACAEHFPLHSPADWCEVCAHATPCYFIYLLTVTWANVYLLHSERTSVWITLCWLTHWPLDFLLDEGLGFSSSWRTEATYVGLR